MNSICEIYYLIAFPEDCNSLLHIYGDNHLHFFIHLVCASDTHVWETNDCVCTIDYYQTTAANETAAAVCTACPPGSATNGITKSSECGKYSQEIIVISECSFCWNGVIAYFQLFWMVESTFMRRVVNVSKNCYTLQTNPFMPLTNKMCKLFYC